jgi:hypothetical protein
MVHCALWRWSLCFIWTRDPGARIYIRRSAPWARRHGEGGRESGLPRPRQPVLRARDAGKGRHCVEGRPPRIRTGRVVDGVGSDVGT